MVELVELEPNLLLLVTSALDLPLRTNKFCSVLFSSSWSSMLVVINKDSLMRGGLCGKLHGEWSQFFALHQSSIDSQLFVRIVIFAYPTCIRRSRWGRRGPRRSIAMTFGIEKLECCGYPIWLLDKKF